MPSSGPASVLPQHGWGPARSSPAARVQAPVPKGRGRSRGGRRAAPGPGRREVSRQGPCLPPGHHEEQDAVERGVRRLECMTERTDRAAGAGPPPPPGRKSDGASLGAQPGLGFHAVSPALPRTRRLLPGPATWGVSLPSCLPSCGCATGGPWRVCWPNSGGSRVPSHHGGDGALLGRVLTEREPGDSTSWPRRLRGGASWAAACCAAPGGHAVPISGGGCEPSHLVLWSSQAAHSCQGRSFLPGDWSVSSEAFP